VRDGQTGEGREEEFWKRRDGVERERERERETDREDLTHDAISAG
jgi:hypothetical protein